MIRTVIILPDDDKVLQDRKDNPYNGEGQRIDAEGNVIAEIFPVDGKNASAGHDRQAATARERTLGDYNMHDQFYANRSAIRPPSFQSNDFELKITYYTLVGQHLFHVLSHEHPMDHIEKFKDLVTSIKYNGVYEDYLFYKMFPYSLVGDATYWLK